MPKISTIRAFSHEFSRNWAPGQDCALCGALAGDRLVCGACERSLPPPADFPDGIVAAFSYAFPLDRLVQRFKFARDLALGNWLGERLADRVAREPAPDVLVAPPLSDGRLRERGFNQALELARAVGRRIGRPAAFDGLTRTRHTPAQAGLGREERLANLGGAFECRRSFEGVRVAIVDDVLTTGATAQALSQVLRSAGASSVETWVVARTPAPGD